MLGLVKLIILTITNMYCVPRVVEENKIKAPDQISPRKDEKVREREGARDRQRERETDRHRERENGHCMR